MNEPNNSLPKEPCAYCGKIGWAWTVENGQNVVKPHNPERCFSNPRSPYYSIYKKDYK